MVQPKPRFGQHRKPGKYFERPDMTLEAKLRQNLLPGYKLVREAKPGEIVCCPAHGGNNRFLILEDRDHGSKLAVMIDPKDLELYFSDNEVILDWGFSQKSIRKLADEEFKRIKNDYNHWMRTA